MAAAAWMWSTHIVYIFVHVAYCVASHQHLLTTYVHKQRNDSIPHDLCTPPPQAVPPTRTKSPGCAESTRKIETPVPQRKHLMNATEWPPSRDWVVPMSRYCHSIPLSHYSVLAALACSLVVITILLQHLKLRYRSM